MTRWAAALVILTTAAVAAATLSVVPVGAQDQPPPVISITPNQDLVDGQVVTVRAARFEPSADAALAVCSAEVLVSLSLTDCDLVRARQFRVGDAGRARVPFTVRRLITTDNGTVDCGAAPRACLLGVATGDLPTQGPVVLGDLQSAWRYLRFEPGPLPAINHLSVVAASPDAVDVSFSCAGSGVVTARVSISQRLDDGDGDVTASATGRAEFRCAGQQQVAVAMSERDGRFRNGQAQIAVGASGPSGEAAVMALVPIRGDRWNSEPATLQADGLDVWIKRARVVGDEVRVRVHLRCPAPVLVDVVATAEQLVGDGVVGDDGSAQVYCGGPVDITVPVRPINHFLTPGRVNLRASVIGLESPIGVFGVAVAPGELDQLVRPQRWTQPAQPDGPVAVGTVTTSGVAVAAECDAVAALVSVRVLQRAGRRIAVTEASGAVPCTGQPVTLDPSQPLAPGAAVLKVRTSLPGEITEQVFRRRVGE